MRDYHVMFRLCAGCEELVPSRLCRGVFPVLEIRVLPILLSRSGKKVKIFPVRETK